MTFGTEIEVRPARNHDLERVMDVLAEASEWLLSRDIKQWPRRFDQQFISAAIERGNTYVALVDREIAGTISLQAEDPIFWPSAPADALYVHRVAVRRRFAGLGRLRMEWAERRAADHRKTYLRLDCWDQNLRLRRYYEDLGFDRRGHKDVVADGHPYRSVLYEKQVSPPT